ncbi:hypothetical protein G9A89_006414 [Geosiphon pyriformis]|nr:hypothetical protein G9A89_006414 [Geosiphon pyriformis]
MLMLPPVKEDMDEATIRSTTNLIFQLLVKEIKSGNDFFKALRFNPLMIVYKGSALLRVFRTLFFNYSYFSMSSIPAKYSIELPNSRKPGQTGIYRNAFYPETLTVSFSPNVTTLYDNFQNAIKISRNRHCIGHRPYNKNAQKYENYVWQTYQEVADRATLFGSGLIYLSETVVKNPETQQWPVGIYSNNRPEWFITDQAMACYNLKTVALYDTLGPDTVRYIITHAEISIIVVAGNRIAGLIQLAPKIPGLKVIISMDELEENEPLPIGSINKGKLLKSWAADNNILLVDFTEVEIIGKEHPVRHNPPKPEDIATICYTSGTTDIPKGVLLTHSNFIGSVGASLLNWDCDYNDVLISYLPLAHIFGRLMELCAIARGASIGYFRGDILTLIEDIGMLKPTIFPSVPRLLTRIYAKIQQSTVEASGFKGALARRAVTSKLQNLEDGQGFSHTVWDGLIFNKVKQVLGGRVRLTVTGSAPIAPEVLQFLRIAFVCEIAEGYGQTEGVASTSVSLKGEYKAGHIGGPSPCNEIKLVDVPEMNYLSTDVPFPRGELCFRGTNAFIGYYKDQDKTIETIDEDGWVHTGAITIVDRKKNIFKLSQGEYIAPEKIENVYLNSPYVLQIYVHGDSLKDYLVAIVVPDPENFVPWASHITGKNISSGDEEVLKQLVNDPNVQKAFLAELDRVGKRGQLRGFELAKGIHLTHIPFSIENDLLTPTLKLKRRQALNHFREKIDQIYAENDIRLHEKEKAKL